MGHGHADLQRHRAPRPGVTDPAGVVCRLDVLAFHADPEARGGIEVEGLVPEQPRRFAPLAQPALPATLGQQLDALTARRDLDLEDVIDRKNEIEGDLLIVG